VFSARRHQREVLRRWRIHPGKPTATSAVSHNVNGVVCAALSVMTLAAFRRLHIMWLILESAIRDLPGRATSQLSSSSACQLRTSYDNSNLTVRSRRWSATAREPTRGFWPWKAITSLRTTSVEWPVAMRKANVENLVIGIAPETSCFSIPSFNMGRAQRPSRSSLLNDPEPTGPGKGAVKQFQSRPGRITLCPSRRGLRAPSH